MEFTELHYKIMKYLKGKGFVHQDEIFKKMKVNCKEQLYTLMRYGILIKNIDYSDRLNPVEYDEFKLSDHKGEPALKNRSIVSQREKLKEFRNWASLTIALLALLLSIYSICKQSDDSSSSEELDTSSPTVNRIVTMYPWLLTEKSSVLIPLIF